MASIMKNVSELMKGMTVPEWILLIVFIIYFVFPVQLPSSVYLAFESIPGMIFVFCFIIYLFLYSHPVLGIFALLAAYEFFYQSTSSYSPSTRKTAFLEYPHIGVTKEILQPVENTMIDLSHTLENVPQTIESVPEMIKNQIEHEIPGVHFKNNDMTLEEEMIQQMAPAQLNNKYVNTNFQPVIHSIGSSSVYQ